MPILGLGTGQFAPRSILLITGLGVLFGLFFSLPPAFGALAMGLSWLPYCVSVILAGLFAGFSLSYLVITFLFDVNCRRVRPATRENVPVLAPPKSATSTIRERLAEGNNLLVRLDGERERRHDSRFGTMTEQRIVWGELLELELQDIDEQISRICSAARDST